MKSVVIVASSPRMAVEMGKPLASLGLRLVALNPSSLNVDQICEGDDVLAVVIEDADHREAFEHLCHSVRRTTPPILSFEHGERLKRRVSALMLKGNCLNLLDQRECTFPLTECFAFDSRDRVIRSAEGDIRLARAETAILSSLAENRGVLVYKSDLLRKLWGRDDKTASRTLDVHLFRLRQKLAQISEHIKITSVRRVGLILEASPG
jgi:hypothetical protein